MSNQTDSSALHTKVVLFVDGNVRTIPAFTNLHGHGFFFDKEQGGRRREDTIMHEMVSCLPFDLTSNMGPKARYANEEIFMTVAVNDRETQTAMERFLAALNAEGEGPGTIVFEHEHAHLDLATGKIVYDDRN